MSGFLRSKTSAGFVTLLGQQGATLLNQANPATGTLYTGSSDGTFVYTVSQPSSPDFLDQLRGGFRVQSISSDGLGTVENGWEWQLEYQVNGTWTFSWYSVTSGTKGAGIQTQTNIGTVTNMRVTLDGTSLSMETSTNNGSSYTARGSTTSSLYQTETGIVASYTGKAGSNLILNNDFSAWTVATAPDNWSRSDSDAGDIVEENANGMRIASDGDGTVSFPRLQQGSFSAGQYWASATIFSVTLGSVQFIFPQGDVGTYTSAQTIVRRGANAFSFARINPQSLNSEFIVSDLSVFSLGSLDASGDGGFTSVVQS